MNPKDERNRLHHNKNHLFWNLTTENLASPDTWTRFTSNNNRKIIKIILIELPVENLTQIKKKWVNFWLFIIMCYGPFSLWKISSGKKKSVGHNGLQPEKDSFRKSWTSFWQAILWKCFLMFFTFCVFFIFHENTINAILKCFNLRAWQCLEGC